MPSQGCLPAWVPGASLEVSTRIATKAHRWTPMIADWLGVERSYFDGVQSWQSTIGSAVERRCKTFWNYSSVH